MNICVRIEVFIYLESLIKIMKINNVSNLLISTFVLSASLFGCGSGGSSGSSTPPTQAGTLISESVQNLGQYENIGSLYPLMMQAGLYIDAYTNYPAKASSTFQKANALNTNQYFNFDVWGNYNNPESSYFKANSVSAYAIQYLTQGQPVAPSTTADIRTASGLIILPNTKNIRGVVVYFKPTTFGKNEVTTCMNVSDNPPAYCGLTAMNNKGFGIYAVLSSLYAARGFAVVVPDYVGQGADWNNVHPYAVYPENNALTAFNMFPSLRKILSDNGVPESQNLPLFLTGYSEGGGYALKAAQMAKGQSAALLSASNLTLKMTAPQEGMYSVIDQINFGFDDNNDGLFNCSSNTNYACGTTQMMTLLNGTSPEVKAMNKYKIMSSMYAGAFKSPLMNYVMGSAMYYSYQNNPAIANNLMNTQFWSNIDMGDGVTANIFQLYSGELGSKYTGTQIGTQLVKNTFLINNYDYLTTVPLTLYAAGVPVTTTPLPAFYYGLNNSASNFINKSNLLNDPTFKALMENGSTYNFSSTNTMVNFINLSYDSTVTVLNVAQAYSCMKYGKNFAGDGQLPASSGTCTATGAGAMIESTVIQNYQLVNDTTQTTPMDLQNTAANSAAFSKFWSVNGPSNLSGTQALLQFGAVPFDHANLTTTGNIVALCAFENALRNVNSGVCPALN